MKDKVFMSHRGHRIWCNECGYMVAKGDGTDYYFSDWKDAMRKINEIEDAKDQKRKEKKKA